MHSPVAVHQTRIVLSAEPDTTSAESCEKVTELMQLPWPSSTWMHSPVLAFQTRIVSSHEPDTTSVESCEKATDMTSMLWPSNICRHWLQSSLTFGCKDIHRGSSFVKVVRTLFLFGENIRRDEYTWSGVLSMAGLFAWTKRMASSRNSDSRSGRPS